MDLENQADDARRRRADIQGLRGVAVLLVVAFHAGLPLPGGFSGVDVFFAISGFVITATLLRELTASGRVDLPRFYGRRIRRLLPALAVMLTVVALLGTFASPLATQRLGALTGIAASVFAANGYLYQVTAGYFDAGSELQPLLHTWTLAVEEQFYLGFPALLLLGWWLLRSRTGPGRRLGPVGVVAAVSALSFLLALKLSSGSTLPGIESPQIFSFYSAPTRAWEFGLGALVALAAPWLGRLSAHAAAILGVAGLAAIGLTAFAVTETPGDPRDLLLPVVGTCALLLAGAAGRGPAARLLGWAPLVWVGDLSYSWYLWHWPLIVFARALWPESHAVVGAAIVSIVPAWISYRWVENPIRVGTRYRGRAVVALAAVCVLVPVGASGALVAVNQTLLGSDAIGEWHSASTPHADQTRGCNGPELADAQRLERCTWRVERPRGRVALVGDSQAGQFTEPLVRAAGRAGYDAVVLTMNSCPLVSLQVSGAPAHRRDCARYNSQTLDVLLRLRPDVVVIASRSDYYVGDSTVALRTQGGTGSRVGAEKARLWHRGLGEVIGRLNEVGSHVVVVHPIPMLGAEPYGCAVLTILVKSCTSGVPRLDADDDRRLAIHAEAAAVAAAPDASAIDFDDELCDAFRCSSAHGGVWMYRDVSHLSVDGSLRLTDRFSRILETDVAEVS